ncbi:ATP-binding protein [Streptomyces sp. NRRL F-2664]|uniref:ATP-binding protein n=1 Tax=Streptomyces sp. NRRL F-2664 TaxID=1463842 RepID=UPI00068940AD|nr:ATP-binding protein [Streptomyces sp. NRRL F-2664]
MSCRQARERAQRVLADCDAPSAVVTDVLTVVSELVANAIRHAGGVTGFDVHHRAGRITIEVSDHSLRLPHARPHAPSTPGRFGWRLVKALAPTVFIRFRRGGKTVTAALPLHAPHP